jgi:drug/metabolite transporter (DMT)-like permease
MENTLTSVQQKVKSQRALGINAALFSAFFLGLTPIFGRQAILLGLSPLGVVAFRTIFATLLLFLVIAVLQPRHLYIYPAGFLVCFLAGLVNGVGSLFFYSALARIDASVGQLLYSLYPLFVAFWLYLDRHPPTRITLIRLILATPAVYLLLQAGGGQTVDLMGVAQMLVASALYALHLPINQRVLYDIPAPTVTLYTLAAMTAVVTPAYLIFGNTSLPESPSFWWPILGLTLVTFLSRVSLFTGVKHLGGMQTAMLGLSELLVTVIFAYILLGESLTLYQWAGAALLSTSIFLINRDKSEPPVRKKGGWFGWLTPPTSVNTTELPWNPRE